jgi:hypothetical protein
MIDFLTHGNAQDLFAIILVLGETMPGLNRGAMLQCQSRQKRFLCISVEVEYGPFFYVFPAAARGHYELSAPRS